MSAAIQDFISRHENVDTAEILLKYRDIHGVPASIIADQIAGRKKAIEKIPRYYSTPGIIYPPLKNLEQSSSERTASFKANLLNDLSKEGICLDLSGGFGVDSFFLSKACKELSMIEPDRDLIEIASYNHKLLGSRNIIHINHNASDFLASSSKQFDFIYIDPSRRTTGNKKVYSLKDSEPNVNLILAGLLQRSPYVLVKASPLLDIQQALSELNFVSKVIVLSVDNECKELLFLLTRERNSDPRIDAVNLQKSNVSRFEFHFSEERSITVGLSPLRAYLYEPNASILKSGAFKIIAKRYNLNKLHPNTHLYTSDVVVQNFPGKIFSVITQVKADPKSLKEYFPGGKANITVRNYPLDPASLKKKTKLTDGGNRFLIGFTGIDKKYLVVAERVN